MKIISSSINRSLVVSLFFVFSNCNLFAQDSSWYNNGSFNKFEATYSPCQVTKKDGTSMQCYAIANKLYSPKGTFHYLESTEGKRKGIKVKELQSIQFKKQRYEVILSEEGGREYMALKAVEGEVSLYLFKELRHIYLPIPFPYGRAGVIAIPYDKYYRFLKSNNQIVNVRKGKFKESMTIYFNKQASVVEKINSEAYNFLNMEILVAEYNSLNSGLHDWTEKPMPYEEVRPKENCSFYCPSSKAAQTSGPRLATVYIYNKPNKVSPSSFEVYVGDSLVRQSNNGAICKYQYGADAIKEFTVVSNTKKSSCTLLINPGRVYYLQNTWDEKNQKYVLKAEDPVAGQYFVDQNNRVNNKIF
jgi:hypothetical protein